MTHENSHLDTFTSDRINTDRIERGIRDAHRLRAQAVRGVFGKFRHYFTR